MIDTSPENLAADIEVAVRGVSGVTTLFRARGLVANIIEASAEALGVNSVPGAVPEASSLVRWEETADGARVELAIGVGAAAGAAETSRRVHAAIEELCASRGVTPSEISVTVVHVDDDTAT